jgi:long-chain fatty acid transport protein
LTVRRLLALTALLLAAGPTTALAGGYELANQAAASSGTGHAGTAREGDPAAAWLNPAILADGGGFRLQLGASLGASTIRAAALNEGDDWTADTDNPLATPPYAYLAMSHAWWTFGATVNLPNAGGVRWADDWRYRFDIIESRPRFLRATAFFGVGFGPFRIAAGPHFDYGELYIHKATDHIASEGSAEIALRGWGAGGHVSVFVRFSDHVQAGVGYKSRTKVALAGEADFEVPPAFAGRFPDGEVSSQLTLPDRIVAGLMLRPKGLERLAILLDLGLTLWSVNDRLELDFADEATTDIVQVNDWQPTMAIRLGAEVELHDRVLVRAGAYVDGLWGAPPPAQTLGPSSPDAPRIGLTVGGRIVAAPWLWFDLYYEHIELLRRESTSPDAPEASYRGFANLGGLSASIRIPTAKKQVDEPGKGGNEG